MWRNHCFLLPSNHQSPGFVLLACYCGRNMIIVRDDEFVQVNGRPLFQPTSWNIPRASLVKPVIDRLCSWRSIHTTQRTSVCSIPRVSIYIYIYIYIYTYIHTYIHTYYMSRGRSLSVGVMFSIVGVCYLVGEGGFQKQKRGVVRIFFSSLSEDFIVLLSTVVHKFKRCSLSLCTQIKAGVLSLSVP